MPEHIVRVNKDNDGNITAVKTDAGQVYRIDQAIMQVRSGNIQGVQVVDREGKEFIRSYPDDKQSNNLDSLPPF